MKEMCQHQKAKNTRATNKVIRNSQHEFSKGKSCFTNWINFYDKMTGLVDEGRTVDISYLDFRKVFDTIFHKILMEKLLMYMDWMSRQ